MTTETQAPDPAQEQATEAPAAWQERQEVRPGVFGDWYDKPNGWSLTRPLEIESGGIKYQFRPLYAAPMHIPTPDDINAQRWAGLDGAVAWHLIDRHGEDWSHIGRLMEAWRAANPPAIQAPEGGERAAFEAEFRKRANLTPAYFSRDPAGYANEIVEASWQGWQARAALAAPAPQTPTQEPAAWLVLDRDGSLIHAAAWREAAHDHINDAISEHGISEAARWVVRPAFIAPQTKEPTNDR